MRVASLFVAAVVGSVPFAASGQVLDFVGGPFTGVTSVFSTVDTSGLGVDPTAGPEFMENPAAFFAGNTGIGIDDEDPVTNPAGITGQGGTLAQAYFENTVRGPGDPLTLVFQIDSRHEVAFDPNAPGASNVDFLRLGDAVIGEQIFDVNEAIDFTVVLEVQTDGDPSWNRLTLDLVSFDGSGGTTFTEILATPNANGVFTARGSAKAGDQLSFASSIGSRAVLTSADIQNGLTSAMTTSSIKMTLIIPTPGTSIALGGFCVLAARRRRRV